MRTPRADTHWATIDLAEEGATVALARALAWTLRAGDVVALTGELGAGKTTFARALAYALGVAPGSVSSPTFVVINQYSIVGVQPSETADSEPSRPLHLAGGELVHVDAYRVRSVEELENAGWDALFDESGFARGLSAALIEWPIRIEEVLPMSRCEIELVATAVHSRQARLGIPKTWLDEAAARPEAAALLELPPTKCRVTGQWVEPTSRTYPFANQRAKEADLYRWLTGGYTTSREATQEDLEAGHDQQGSTDSQ